MLTQDKINDAILTVFTDSLEEFPEAYAQWDNIDSSSIEWEAGYLRGVQYACNNIKVLLNK